MKRIISVLIIFTLTVSLFACGGAAVPTEKEQNQPSQTTTSVEDSTAEPTAAEVTPEPITETILAEADWVSMKVTSIDQDSQGGYLATFSIKNELDVSLTAYIVFTFNGWISILDRFSFSVKPLAEETEQFTVPATFFSSCGVDTVNEITLQYSIYSDDNKNSIRDSVSIYPLGEEAAKSAPAFKYIAKETDIPLGEIEDAIAAVTNFSANDKNGYDMSFYVENTSDKRLVFSLSSCGVNGYVLPLGIYSPSMLPGTRFIITLPIKAEDLVSNSISEITQVDLNYSLYETGNSSYEYSGSKTFYPSGEETPRVERTPVDGELVLVDNKDFTIIVTGCLNNPDSSRYGLSIYAENKTDKVVSIEVQNPEVNGEPCFSNSLIAELPAGMRTNMIYKWNVDAFEKAGLTDDTVVEQVTLPIFIFSDGNRKAGDEVYKHTFKVKVW